MKLVQLSIAAMLLGANLSAHALTTTVTSGPSSLVSGAYVVDFGTSAVNNTAPLSNALPSGTQGGIGYSYTGGAEFNFDATSGLPSGTAARPVGSTGNFYSVGVSPSAQMGPGFVNFTQAVSYFGFLWGSPDSYNTVSFFNGNQLLGAYTGSAVLANPNGDQGYAQYFNVFAGAGEAITKVEFSSSGNAFETDNHAFLPALASAGAKVPEPDALVLMLTGLGLLGTTTLRRKA